MFKWLKNKFTKHAAVVQDKLEDVTDKVAEKASAVFDKVDDLKDTALDAASAKAVEIQDRVEDTMKRFPKVMAKLAESEASEKPAKKKATKRVKK